MSISAEGYYKRAKERSTYRDYEGIKAIYQKYIKEEGSRRHWTEREAERAQGPGARPRGPGGRPVAEPIWVELKAVASTDLEDE